MGELNYRKNTMEKIISSPQNLIVFIIYLALIIVGIALILKNEKKLPRILWLMVVILFPYIGSVIYLLKYLLTKRNQFSGY
jgi:uncharacterized membrane protein YhaH (DUF805 family)